MTAAINIHNVATVLLRGAASKARAVAYLRPWIVLKKRLLAISTKFSSQLPYVRMKHR